VYMLGMAAAYIAVAHDSKADRFFHCAQK
jgi:hypothetical protein